MNVTGYLSLLTAVAVLTISSTAIGASADKVVYRAPLPEGREVTVVKAAMVPGGVANDLLDLPARDTTITGFCVFSVEIRPADGPPARIWSQMYPVYSEEEFETYQFLDLLRRPGHLIIAMWGAGSISVFDIGIVGPSKDAPLTEWSLIAVTGPATPGRVGAKLSYDEKSKRVNVHVTDKLEDTCRHSLYEQKQDAWEFARLRQWDEKLATPTTQPGKS